MAKGSPHINVIAGIITTTVAAVNLVFCIAGLMQSYCLIDLLRGIKTSTFIKVLYFNRPQCTGYINLGEVVAEYGSQAFIFTPTTPETTSRNLIILYIYLPLTFLWLLAGAILVMAGSRKSIQIRERVIWMIITATTVFVDIIVASLYGTDIKYTRTSTALAQYIGATISGAGNVVVDTSLAAITMMVFYLRFGIFLLTNIILIIWMLVDTGMRTDSTEAGSVQSLSSVGSVSVARDPFRIPRAFLLKRLPTWLTRPPTTKTHTHEEHEAASRPMRLANLMTERRRQLSESVIDTSMRNYARDTHGANVFVDIPWATSHDEAGLANMSPQRPRRLAASIRLSPSSGAEDSFVAPTAADIHPLPSTSHHDHTGRRGTAAELQGQLPWSYIPPSAHRMRDNLPEDEDLPPVPVPDYTLHPKYRKASVHRAGSSVSTTVKAHTDVKAVHRAGSSVSTTAKPHTDVKGTASDVLY